jgi:hypothetical protein
LTHRLCFPTYWFELPGSASRFDGPAATVERHRPLLMNLCSDRTFAGESVSVTQQGDVGYQSNVVGHRAGRFKRVTTPYGFGDPLVPFQ